MHLKATLRVQMPLHKQEDSRNTIASGIIRQLHRFGRDSKNSRTDQGYPEQKPSEEGL